MTSHNFYTFPLYFQVTDFFDFNTKLKNNEINKLRAKEAESINLKIEGIKNFNDYENNAIKSFKNDNDNNIVYTDDTNGFLLNIPSSWTISKKDKLPQASGQYQVEKIMVTGNNYIEGRL